jgi:thiamine-phosphate pyrophosphorylase
MRDRGPALRERLRLYVVTDERADGRSLLRVLEEAIIGGATAVQLRRKEETGRRLVELGHAVRRLTRESGVLFFVNDRVDVALLVDADGVHVGQQDISCRDARRLLPNRLVGVSAATVREAVDAEQSGADYVGAGAVWSTASKPDADMCGLEGLRDIARAVAIPAVAIGGIGPATVARVREAGASGAAVVSAVMSAPDPRDAARRLRRGMGG